MFNLGKMQYDSTYIGDIAEGVIRMQNVILVGDVPGVFQDSCHYFCLKLPVLFRLLFPGSVSQSQPVGSF